MSVGIVLGHLVRTIMLTIILYVRIVMNALRQDGFRIIGVIKKLINNNKNKSLRRTQK